MAVLELVEGNKKINILNPSISPPKPSASGRDLGEEFIQYPSTSSGTAIEEDLKWLVEKRILAGAI